MRNRNVLRQRRPVFKFYQEEFLKRNAELREDGKLTDAGIEAKIPLKKFIRLIGYETVGN